MKSAKFRILVRSDPYAHQRSSGGDRSAAAFHPRHRYGALAPEVSTGKGPTICRTMDIRGVAAVALTADFRTLGPGPRSFRSIFEGLITEFGTRKNEAWNADARGGLPPRYTRIAPSFETSPDLSERLMNEWNCQDRLRAGFGRIDGAICVSQRLALSASAFHALGSFSW